ncbi:MAG: S1C family serine protease [Bacteroidia bacterium]
MIGINTAIATESGYYEGYAFAIPSNLVWKVAQDLMIFGKVQRGFLGITASNITPNFLSKFRNVKGVQIQKISDDSPAQLAGLKENDIIIEIEGKKIQNLPQFYEKIACYPPNQTINTTIMRNGNMKQVNITLKEFHYQIQKNTNPNQMRGISIQYSNQQFYLQFERKSVLNNSKRVSIFSVNQQPISPLLFFTTKDKKLILEGIDEEGMPCHFSI